MVDEPRDTATAHDLNGLKSIPPEESAADPAPEPPNAKDQAEEVTLIEPRTGGPSVPSGVEEIPWSLSPEVRRQAATVASPTVEPPTKQKALESEVPTTASDLSTPRNSSQKYPGEWVIVPPRDIGASVEVKGDRLPAWLSWPLDLILMVGLAWLAWTGVTMTYNGYGHSWDEALYLKPGRQALTWWMNILAGDRSMLTDAAIEAHWGQMMEDPLHPEIAPVPKVLIGLGDSRILEAFLPNPPADPISSTRLPHAALFALTVALIYLLGARDGGRLVGLMAAVAFGMAPRVFGHAHIAASETALLFTCTLMLLAWQSGMRAWILGLLFAGPVMGLVLATKVTAAILPLPLMVWALVYRRRYFGPAAFSLMFLAPATILAVWPWFWHDTVMRMAEYAQFYASHQSTALWYLGRPWGYTHGPAAPWHYPLFMLGAGLPEWIILFALGGILRALWGFRRRPYPVLWLLVGLSWLLLASSPAAPKYDGDRLFIPVMISIALLAGHGLGGLLILIFDRRLYQTKTLAMLKVLVGFLIITVCAAWAAWDIRNWQGAHLNYFNRVVGGARGAQKLGFETTYWGESVNEEVIRWLRDNASQTSGVRVRTLALNPLALENLQEWGELPRTIDFTPEGPDPVDWFVIQAREGFHGRLERAVWALPPAAEIVVGDLPRVRIVDGRKFSESPKAPAASPETGVRPTESSLPNPVSTPVILPPAPPPAAASTPPPDSTPAVNLVPTPIPDTTAVPDPVLTPQPISPATPSPSAIPNPILGTDPVTTESLTAPSGTSTTESVPQVPTPS